MDNIEKGLIILSDVIVNNKKHRDYDYVNKLADEYYDIFTGAGISKHLKNIVKREDKELFEQRVNLYNSAIPSTVNKALTIFNKVTRSNRVYSSVEHTNNKSRDEVLDRIKNFWQSNTESGVDAYIRQQWMYLITYDPNAFISVEFSDFDPIIEKTYPFPKSYSSKEVINFNFLNGNLEWVIAKVDHLYKKDNKGATAAGAKYLMYLDNHCIVLSEVDKTTKIKTYQDSELHQINKKDNSLHSIFEIQYFNTNTNGVPLIRAGYNLDPVTQNRTAVSIIHPAMNYFKDELKNGSEFALTMSLHVFPQKIMFGVPCPGDETSGESCHNGRGLNGGTCATCNGSGVIPVHTSAQDVLEVKMPQNGEPLPDLNKYLVYKNPPIDLIKFQEQFLDTLADKAIRSIFNIEDLSRSIKTATEIEYSEDNVQDTLFATAQMYSTVWSFIVEKIAVLTDNYNGIDIYHQFAKDLKLKSISQLMNEAKVAKDSGLSQHAIEAINKDILEAYYADDQDTLTKLKIKDKFQPFAGKSDSEIQSILLSGEVLPFYKYLYIYFSSIFNDIENEYGDKFYLMDYTNQKSIVKSKVDEIIKDIDDLLPEIMMEDYES